MGVAPWACSLMRQGCGLASGRYGDGSALNGMSAIAPTRRHEHLFTGSDAGLMKAPLVGGNDRARWVRVLGDVANCRDLWEVSCVYGFPSLALP
ncbi:MAG: hypothetical protein ACJAZN_001349 [Planctomycetota bacterium]|jgi:hypothetical protein